MENKSKKSNFIMQAGILAIAGIASRIIGLLYRSPLHGVIGDLGLGYYQSAYVYYTIILLISSYSIPSAISKVIAQKLAVHEYINAHRIFRGALIYVLFVGGAASIFLYFGAGLFVEKAAIPVLRTFAPTIFVYGILGVLRGYFQAHNSMVQTSVSQILEQIVNAEVSVLAAYFMMEGLKTASGAAGKVESAVHGAIGSALGTGSGVLAALIFMAGIYFLNSKMIYARIKRDRHKNIHGYATIFKMITAVVTPFILSTAIYNLSSSVNTKIYTGIYPSIKMLDTVKTTSIWGIFSGQALTISNIPIAFASAMASAMIPSITQLMAADHVKEAKQKIALAVKTTMLISIPCAAGLFALAEPITDLLFHNTPETLQLAGRLLMALSVSVIFYALSTLNSSILQGIGKVNAPIVNSAVALTLQTIIAIVLLLFTKVDIYSIVIANTVYSGAMCVLNERTVRKAIGYRQEYRKTFFIPLLASGIMGAFAYILYKLLFLLTNSMKIAVIPSIVAGAIIYFVMLILLKGISEEELKKIPKGYIVIKMAKKMRLMKDN